MIGMRYEAPETLAAAVAFLGAPGGTREYWPAAPI